MASPKAFRLPDTLTRILARAITLTCTLSGFAADVPTNAVLHCGAEGNESVVRAAVQGAKDNWKEEQALLYSDTITTKILDTRKRSTLIDLNIDAEMQYIDGLEFPRMLGIDGKPLPPETRKQMDAQFEKAVADFKSQQDPVLASAKRDQIPYFLYFLEVVPIVFSCDVVEHVILDKRSAVLFHLTAKSDLRNLYDAFKQTQLGISDRFGFGKLLLKNKPPFSADLYIDETEKQVMRYDIRPEHKFRLMFLPQQRTWMYADDRSHLELRRAKYQDKIWFTSSAVGENLRLEHKDRYPLSFSDLRRVKGRFGSDVKISVPEVTPSQN